MAVERLAQKGCRRLLLVIGDDSTTNYHNIVTAFHRTAARAGMEGEVLDGSQTKAPAEMRQLGIELAGQKERADGIICDSEMRTIALVGGLEEGGRKPGQGIELVYKQTSDILPALFPRLDSVREDVFGAGVELTRLLLRRIEGVPAEQLQTLAAPEPHWRS
jgi:LacI family transcriptional regulator